MPGATADGDGSQPRCRGGRAVELALRWPGPGSVVLNVGTGRNHSVMHMLAVASRAATPALEHQAPLPLG